MAHTLEACVPLKDRLLADCLFTLTGRLNASRRQLRSFLNPLLREAIPTQCIFKATRGLMVPVEKLSRVSVHEETRETLVTQSGNHTSRLAQRVLPHVWNCFWKGTLSWSRVWCRVVFEHREQPFRGMSTACP
jgi:hypothetical protein